jgi:nucleotide-binding universal stress UspA family protein
MNVILCPTDFSTCASNALNFAHDLAVRSRSRLVLLHVGTEGEGRNQDRLEETCRRLQRQHPEGAVVYQSLTAPGPVAEAISAQARETGADLVVMGTTGALGSKELLTGSLTARVISRVKCPVLAIPKGAPFVPFSRIVLATGLPDEQLAKALVVTDIARLYEAEILLLHLLADDSLSTRSVAQSQYARISQQLAYDKFSVHTQTGNDWEEDVLRFAHNLDAHLVVMFHHSHSFWEGIFTRIQTRQMAYYSSIPLLAIHR